MKLADRVHLPEQRRQHRDSTPSLCGVPQRRNNQCRQVSQNERAAAADRARHPQRDPARRGKIRVEMTEKNNVESLDRRRACAVEI